MGRWKFLVGIAIGICMGLGGAWALQEKDEAPAKMSPPSPLEDEFLERFVGEWEITGTTEAGGEKHAFTATESFEWILNHQFLVSNYEAPMGPGMPTFEGMAVARSTPGTKDYELWWFDIDGDGEKSEGKRDGNTVVYTAPPKSGKHEGTISTMTLMEDGGAHHVYKILPKGQTEWMTFFDVKGRKK